MTTEGRSRAEASCCWSWLLLLGAGAVAAYLLLPAADITVTPQIEAIGPISFTVTADPTRPRRPRRRGHPRDDARDPRRRQGSSRRPASASWRQGEGRRPVHELRPLAVLPIPKGTIVRRAAGPASRSTRRCSCPSRGSRVAAQHSVKCQRARSRSPRSSRARTGTCRRVNPGGAGPVQPERAARDEPRGHERRIGEEFTRVSRRTSRPRSAQLQADPRRSSRRSSRTRSGSRRQDRVPGDGHGELTASRPIRRRWWARRSTRSRSP